MENVLTAVVVVVSTAYLFGSAIALFFRFSAPSLEKERLQLFLLIVLFVIGMAGLAASTALAAELNATTGDGNAVLGLFLLLWLGVFTGSGLLTKWIFLIGPDPRRRETPRT